MRELQNDTLDIFDQTVQKTYLILKEIKEDMGLSSMGDSYLFLRATLHSLRECIPAQQSLQLGNQLPMLLRGIFYEEWTDLDKESSFDEKVDFFNLVGEKLGENFIKSDLEKIVKSVLKSLIGHTSIAEDENTLRNLPADLFEVEVPENKINSNIKHNESYSGVLTFE